jgi:hypothetical protein
MLAGQAEHISTVYSEVLSVNYVRFFFNKLSELIEKKPNITHGVHVRYLFDPLLSQGMEIETLCPKRVVLF